MNTLFDPAFVERQQALHPDLDVYLYVALVVEFARRKDVRNPNGLLVHWLSRAERLRRQKVAVRAAAQVRELERYAEFWLELLRVTSQQGLSPAQLAACIEAARAEGYPNLNAALAGRLRACGGSWPSSPPAPRPQSHPTATRHPSR